MAWVVEGSEVAIQHNEHGLHMAGEGRQFVTGAGMSVNLAAPPTGLPASWVMYRAAEAERLASLFGTDWRSGISYVDPREVADSHVPVTIISHHSATTEDHCPHVRFVSFLPDTCFAPIIDMMKIVLINRRLMYRISFNFTAFIPTPVDHQPGSVVSYTEWTAGRPHVSEGYFDLRISQPLPTSPSA